MNDTNNEKLPCSVIEDLIPLCKEGLCSGESRAIVEEHIARCESCRVLYKSIEPPKAAELSSEDEKKPFRKVNSRLKRSRAKVIILSVLLAVIVLPLMYLMLGQMIQWNGATSFETIAQSLETRRIADAFMSGDIELFSDFMAYDVYLEEADKSFSENYAAIVENDKAELKRIYHSVFDGLRPVLRKFRTTYELPGLTYTLIHIQWYDDENGFTYDTNMHLTKTYYGKYECSMTGYGRSEGSNEDFDKFVRLFDYVKYHNVDIYHRLEQYIPMEDPLGTFDTGGGKAVLNEDGTYTTVPDIRDPAITYLREMFAEDEADHIMQSVVSFLEKGYSIENCSVSVPFYDPEREMMYYNLMLTVSDKDGQGHAVLQARMYYDYNGIYTPEITSIAPGGCSAELILDLGKFFDDGK